MTTAPHWLSAWRVYAHPHMVGIALLGLVSGFPLALTASTLGAWLNAEGISKTAIGLFALVGTPYTLKFLWAPLMDQLAIPGLTKRLGRRRSWLLVSQLALMGALFALGSSDPKTALGLTALFALFTAIASASQDIVIDAYRVEILEERQQGAGAASIVFGYNVGMRLIGGGLALILADQFSWQAVYALMAALVLLGSAVVWRMGEPKAPPPVKHTHWLDWLDHAVIAPFREFLTRPGWLYLLLFIALYKFGDAFAGLMTIPFLQDIGFSNTEIGLYLKGYGLAATLFGTFLGGVLVYRIGMIGALWASGAAQMLSNLMFVWQAHLGYDPHFVIALISVENISAGMGTAAFVAFISQLCNAQYTATQYALLSSLAAIGRTLLSSSSGVMVDLLGWVPFFLLSTAVALPGLFLLSRIGRFYKPEK